MAKNKNKQPVESKSFKSVVERPVVERPVIKMLKNTTVRKYFFNGLRIDPGQCVPYEDKFDDDKPLQHAISLGVMSVFNE